MEKRMPLIWDIAETTAYKNKDQYENFDFILDAIVFSTMAVDIGQIKNEDLADQFVDRIILIESNFGWLYKRKGESLLADRKLLKAFIGLRTNVTTLPFNKWYKTKILDRRADNIRSLKNFKSKLTHFIDDEEKMKDFKKLSREEFLNTYSYLYPEEYELTLQAIKGLKNVS